MPYNSRADVVRFMAERYDTKSSVNICYFRLLLIGVQIVESHYIRTLQSSSNDSCPMVSDRGKWKKKSKQKLI